MIIVYYHILHSNILPYIGSNKIYDKLADLSTYSGYIVECFFIISGYFLFKKIKSNPNLPVVDFIVDKIVRLGPVLWFSILINVIFFSQNIYDALFQGCFLQCVGLSLNYRGINWYISPFFWASIFLFCFPKLMKEKHAVFLIGVLTYFSYVININYCNGGLGRETVYGFLNLGLLRAIGGIGLGYIIGGGRKCTISV